MKERTQLEQLYIELFRICVRFAVYYEHVMSEVQKLLPELEQFAAMIFNTSDLGASAEDDRLLRQLLLDLLKDLLQSLENQDEVLLEDTLEYGWKEFLELFIGDEARLHELRKESMNEQSDL